MEFTSRHSRLFVKLFVLLLVLIAAAAVAYLAFGGELTAALYQHPPGWLPSVIWDGAADGTEAAFKARLDSLFWYRFVLGVPLTLLFAYAVFGIFRYLFRQRDLADTAVEALPDKRFRADWVLALGAYSLATLLYFHANLADLGSSLIGPAEDNLQFLWNYWLGNRVLIEGQGSLFFTQMIYYPGGESMLYHSLSFYNLFPAVLLQQFISLVLTYNLLVLHTFILAGLGAFFLIRYLVRDSIAAIVGGFIFAFNPWHVVQAQHHINIASIQFVPFFVLFFIMAVRNRRLLHLELAILFLILASLGSWNYLVFGGYFMVFAYAYKAIRRRRLILRDLLWRIIAITVVTAAVLSPWLGPMVLAAIRHPVDAVSGHNWLVGDLFGFIVPPQAHLLGEVDLLEKANASYTGLAWETTVYLGLAALGLVAVMFRKIIRSSAAYFIGGLSFLLLSFGAHIHVLGATSPISLPYRILGHLPFLANIRSPARNVVFVYLFLAIIVALAIRYLRGRQGQSHFGRYLPVLVILVLVVDYFPVTTELTPWQVPACYEAIPKTGKQFGILDLPSGYAEVNRYMAYQCSHELPLVQGWTSRRIHKTLLDSLEVVDLARQRQQLIDNQVKYIVIHHYLTTPGRPPNLSEYPEFYRRVYEDSANTIWQVY